MNTLKFGNGEWYGKKDTILAYNDENSNFKPLPFSFDRASSATVVNKDGLIETVGSGEPRIDYKDDSKGALLLEPSRSNSLVQSNQFDTTWTINASALDLTSGQSGVYGSNDAWLLKKNYTGSRFLQQSVSLSSAQYSYSVYLKAESTNWVLIWSYDGSTGVEAYFDLENGVVGDTGGSNLDSTNIESVGNGWYRCTLTYTRPTTLVRIYPADDNGSVSPTDDNGIYIQNAQLEQGSYATSYIPTQGGAVTRVAESCEQTVPSGIIGQTEGTMYGEIDFKSKPEAGSPIVGIMTLNNNVNNLQNCIILGIERQSGGINRFYPFVQVGNSTVAYIIGGTLTDGNYKVAFAYKQNDFILYVNGVQIGTDTNGAVPTTSQVLVGERYNGDTIKIADGIKETKLYNTRLSNAELQALTTI